MHWNIYIFPTSKGVGKRKSTRYWDRINKATKDWMCLVSPENVIRWGINQRSFSPILTTLSLSWDVPVSDWKKNRSQILSHTELSLFYRLGAYIFSQVKRQHQGSNQVPVSGNQSKAWGKVGVETEGGLFIFNSDPNRVSPFQVSTLYALSIMMAYTGK